MGEVDSIGGDGVTEDGGRYEEKYAEVHGVKYGKLVLKLRKSDIRIQYIYGQRSSVKSIPVSV